MAAFSFRVSCGQSDVNSEANYPALVVSVVGDDDS
jgi:hypothetical protein